MPGAILLRGIFRHVDSVSTELLGSTDDIATSRHESMQIQPHVSNEISRALPKHV